jgi:hydroxyacylglutathione hydrolase
MLVTTTRDSDGVRIGDYAMSLVFERVFTDGIAQCSYLIGDAGSGTAAVIDPRPDCDVYLHLARKRSVAITHVFETHIHADFLSGARELVNRLGGAELCVSGEGGAKYGFEVHAIRGGQCFSFGSVVLTARHTPGHTPEHLAFELAEEDQQDAPWGILTGDSLFVGSAGRPDLLGEERVDALTRELFQTLHDYYLKQDDSLIIYPCHGAGSACGAAIGRRPMSTIGYERQQNDFLQHQDLEAFARFVRDGAPPEPYHYQRLKELNAEGPPILGRLPTVPPLPPQAFKAAVERGAAQLLDTRQMFAFGGGHIAGAVNIGPRAELSVWAGQMLDSDRPILLVVENEPDLDRTLRLLWRTGFTQFAGYLVGGMKAWSNTGFPLQKLPQIAVHELQTLLNELQVLDVRAPDEWQAGHIPRARHVFVADLRDGLDGAAALDRNQPLAVYCDTGYRAAIAASLLQARGFRDVRNVPGSWQAWTKSGYAIEK